MTQHHLSAEQFRDVWNSASRVFDEMPHDRGARVYGVAEGGSRQPRRQRLNTVGASYADETHPRHRWLFGDGS